MAKNKNNFKYTVSFISEGKTEGIANICQLVAKKYCEICQLLMEHPPPPFQIFLSDTEKNVKITN